MDLLVDLLTKFNINRDETEFDESIEDIIHKLKKQEINESDYEWETLCKNFSSILYLHDTIRNYYVPESEKFINCLEVFMSKMDTINARYMSEIDWTQKEHADCEAIKDLLDRSYYASDPILKLEYCVNAYKLFVPVIETIRKEKYLIEEPEHQFKRKRIN